MKQILSDYYKHYSGMIISNCCLAVLVPVMCIFNGFSWETTSDKIILSLYILAEALALWSLLDGFFGVPRRLKIQLAGMPEEERSEILTQYPKAKLVNKHRYMENHFVFYFADKIYLLRYSDVKTAQLKSPWLKLTVAGYKKQITMPFSDYGTNAVALAFLREKNHDITIISSERTNTK